MTPGEIEREALGIAWPQTTRQARTVAQYASKEIARQLNKHNDAIRDVAKAAGLEYPVLNVDQLLAELKQKITQMKACEGGFSRHVIALMEIGEMVGARKVGATLDEIVLKVRTRLAEAEAAKKKAAFVLNATASFCGELRTIEGVVTTGLDASETPVNAPHYQIDAEAWDQMVSKRDTEEDWKP